MKISKHLMLLFIPQELSNERTLIRFQNISCYCLSPKKPVRWQKECNFKTSHVIVYRVLGCTDSCCTSVFQNISCYCLSVAEQQLEQKRQAFQNISCYCLSDIFIPFSSAAFYFKTSHVIVYRLLKRADRVQEVFQNISCYCLSVRAVG